MKNGDIFVIFAQNTDHGYMLELTQNTHNQCLKEYAHKDYLSFQKKGAGETFCKKNYENAERFRRYDHLYFYR